MNERGIHDGDEYISHGIGEGKARRFSRTLLLLGMILGDQIQEQQILRQCRGLQIENGNVKILQEPGMLPPGRLGETRRVFVIVISGSDLKRAIHVATIANPAEEKRYIGTSFF